VDHKKAVLTKLLESNGWCVEAREDSDVEWWADELWQIRSTWRPTDYELYLTFLVDPLYDGNRSKGQAVWALGVARTLPRDRLSASESLTLQLNPKFERGLKQFIVELGQLREGAV